MRSSFSHQIWLNRTLIFPSQSVVMALCEGSPRVELNGWGALTVLLWVRLLLGPFIRIFIRYFLFACYDLVWVFLSLLEQLDERVVVLDYLLRDLKHAKSA